MRPTTLRPPPMRKPQQRHHVTKTLPAPVGGMDSISPLALMPPNNAVEMDNFISSDSGLALREGWYEYACHLDNNSPIRTIFSYDAAPANSTVNPLSESELFAATDHGIFFIEGGGDCAAALPKIALTGNTNAGRFSTVQFATNGGNFLIACSETDGAYLYDGLTWMKMVLGGTAGPGHITGVDPMLFVQVVAWKKRLIFVERASSKAWFLPVDVVGGDAKLFDFGPLLAYGGVVTALLNWTMDAGAGVDDRLVMLGSCGDLAIYEGLDPGDATQFRNVGSWYIGQMPIGRRNFTTSGGNIYVLCQYGLVPVSQVVQGGLDNILTSNTEMLKQLRLMQEQFARDFLIKIDREGWEVLDIPAKVLMLILRPKVTTTDHVSYCFQMHSLAWSRLIDIPAVTVAQRLNEVYAGTEDGDVLRIFDGHSDGKEVDGTGATEIKGRITPAFNYFGNPDVIKQALMMRPTFLSSGPVAYTCYMNVDFYLRTDTVTPIPRPPLGPVWDQARWEQAFWAPDFVSSYEWRNVSGMGYALAPTIYVSSQNRIVLASIEYMLRPGGVL